MGKPGIERSCLSKISFRSETRAIHYYENIAKNREGLRHELKPYKCLYCDGWHLGRPRKKKKKKKKEGANDD